METNFGLHALEGEWHALLPRYLYVAQRLTGLRVLELGCGRGVGTCLLHHLGVEELRAIDSRAGLVDAARLRFPQLGDAFGHMDYSSMSFESGSFDAVVCLGLEPPVSDLSFVEEVKRVLTDKGIFFGVLPDASAYGLDKLLPNLDGISTDLHPGPAGEEPKVLLEKSFSFVSVIDQSPTLGFVFSVGDEQTEKSQEISLPGVQAKESPIAQLVFCAAAPLEIPDVRFRVPMSYRDLSTRLGGTINELYQQIDMLDHRTIAFEGRADDDVQLIDDLEEEVRSQRALSQDQSAQIEELKQQFAEIASVPDLTVDFARLQVELAGRQKEVLDLTADFNRRFQDMIWSLEDRDVYIDSLSARIHEWEVYGEGLRRELEAREFALEAQGQVLTRCQEALKDVGLEETSPSEDAEPKESVSASETAILRALEDEGKLLRERLEEALSARGDAEAAMLRMRDTMRSNHSELASKTAYAQSLENRIVQEENQAKTFASEVGGLYEEVNDLKKSLEKAEAKIWGRLQKLRSGGGGGGGASPGRTVGVLGCMAERLKERLLDAKDGADLVVGPDAYRDLPRLLALSAAPDDDPEAQRLRKKDGLEKMSKGKLKLRMAAIEQAKLLVDCRAAFAERPRVLGSLLRLFDGLHKSKERRSDVEAIDVELALTLIRNLVHPIPSCGDDYEDGKASAGLDALTAGLGDELANGAADVDALAGRATEVAVAEAGRALGVRRASQLGPRVDGITAVSGRRVGEGRRRVHLDA